RGENAKRGPGLQRGPAAPPPDVPRPAAFPDPGARGSRGVEIQDAEDGGAGMTEGAGGALAEDFYRRALDALARSGAPFLIGGAYALEHHTGIVRRTKDLDLFVRPQEV